MFRRVFLAALLWAGNLQTVVWAAAPAAPPPASRARTAEPVDSANYRISPGDMVSVVVFPVTEYSREATVQPDGMIELPLLEPFPARGLTPAELQNQLEEKYRRYVSDVKITVNVRRFIGRRVSVVGEARGAGFFEYRDGMRLLDLIVLSGGFSEVAKPSKARLMRQNQGEITTIRVNLRRVLEGDSKYNIALEPGDTIYIPKGRLTRNTQWVNANILPWASFFGLIASLVILSRQVN